MPSISQGRKNVPVIVSRCFCRREWLFEKILFFDEAEFYET